MKKTCRSLFIEWLFCLYETDDWWPDPEACDLARFLAFRLATRLSGFKYIDRPFFSSLLKYMNRRKLRP